MSFAIQTISSKDIPLSIRAIKFSSKAFIKKEELNKKAPELLGEDVRETYRCNSVKVPDPKFSSQTKENCISEVEGVVTQY